MMFPVVCAGIKLYNLFMDIKQQTRYWVVSGEEDFAAAQSLLDKGHLRHCLFFAHLAIEKMLKAHVVKTTLEIPPKIHDLIRLTEISQLHPTQEQMSFLRRFGLYQLEGRYPDTAQAVIDAATAKEKIESAKEIMKWLKAQL